jgi:hypothetical protein
VRRTPAGTYRLVPVAACGLLDGCAALIDVEAAAGGGLLVVGTDETPDEAVAMLVLGPLALVRVLEVPWEWIRQLTTPAADPLGIDRVALPEPTVVYVPAGGRPQHDRRMPSWRSPKPTTRRRTPSAPERLAA